MLDEQFKKLPPSTWKPFGNGARGCIGRAFTFQESHIILTMLLQNFEFQAYDPDYKLQILTTLTAKPKGFFMHGRLRPGLDPVALEKRLWSTYEVASKILPKDNVAESVGVSSSKSLNLRSMRIYYGSNTGTCRTLAHALASEVLMHGFNATVDNLNTATGRLPNNSLIAIITSSYESEPPDNAGYFVKWLNSLEDLALTGTKHAMFGCGNSLSDAANNGVFNDFDGWASKEFWPALKKNFSVQEFEVPDTEGFDIEIIKNSPSVELHDETKHATVKLNKLLTATSEPGKRHIEIELPPNTTYQTGDHLAILLTNPHKLVKRIISHFGLALEATIILKSEPSKGLPSGQTIYNLLSSNVELNQPATEKNILNLVKSTSSQSEANTLRALTPSEVLASRTTVFDLLTLYPTSNLSFGAYLAMLPPLRPRLVQSGVARFRPPTMEEAEAKPIVMPCAGSGIAPFRGFVQHRVELLKTGERLAPALLFVGCRHLERDLLYEEEIKTWVSAGAVKVYYTFSQAMDKSDGCAYVQERIWKERTKVVELFKTGGRIYVCGSRKICDGIRDGVTRAYEELKGVGRQEAEVWFKTVGSKRFAVDIFG
ncbi:hypothetical protein B0O99DRAFT_719766 [Bisporella sp. PMI_857]|nr:hypothetical protein B0O99DRAFT_719766 [Bisporella sp. PMI_857]